MIYDIAVMLIAYLCFGAILVGPPKRTDWTKWSFEVIYEPIRSLIWLIKGMTNSF